MTVVPKCTPLVLRVGLVLERLPRRDSTLCDRRDAIHEIILLLIDVVLMDCRTPIRHLVIYNDLNGVAAIRFY